MDDHLSNDSKQVAVRMEELESKIRSKEDLNYLLRNCCEPFLITFRPILPSSRQSLSNQIPPRHFLREEEG